jgi:hypothetical protein
LEYYANISLMRGSVANILAIKNHIAIISRGQAGNNAQKRRLAAARRAQQ